MINNSIIPLYKQIDKFIVKSKGCYLYDSDNNEYLDFESGDWAANLGHANKRISTAIKGQADLLIHDGLRFRNKQSEELSVRLSEKLSLTKGKSVFLNSGSEAVNLAITMAKNLTRRTKVLKMDCSYLSAFGHGQISASNSDLLSVPINDIEAVPQIDFRNIAAFVFEPGNSSSLIKYPSNEFIKLIASAIKQNGGLLIANEVTTGFGRTGKWFGFQHYDFVPDIVATGKALGNGYPISCVSISKEIARLFDESPFRYAQSHQNDPLGCAVALEVISIFDDEGIIQKSYHKGLYFKDQLQKLQAKYPAAISDVRARGLMVAIELSPLYNAGQIYLQLIENGLLAGQRENVLRFMPPLIIEESQIDQLIGTLDNILSLSASS